MKRVLTFVMGVALLGAALFSIGTWLKDKPLGQSSGLSVATRLAPTNAVSKTWNLAVGTELTYQIEYRGNVEQSASSSAVQGAQILTGKLHLGVLERQQQSYLTVVWLDADAPQDAASEATYKILSPLLKNGVEVQLGLTGFELQLVHPEVVGDPVRVFWQSMFDRLMVHRDAELDLVDDTEERSLSRKETFGDLAIASTYLWTCATGCAHDADQVWQVTRKIKSQGGSDRSVEGQTEVVMQANRQGILSLQAKLLESFGFGSSSFRINSDLHLSFIDEKRANPELWSKKMATFEAPKVVPSPVTGSDTSIDEAVLAGLDESQILVEIRQNQDLSELPQASYLRLKSWIALHPESLVRLTESLAGPNGSESALQAYIKALGAIGHKAAQAALIDIVRLRAQDEETTGRALTALALVKNPDVSTEKSLLAVVQGEFPVPAQEKAKLVLGAVGHHLRQSSDPGDLQRADTLEKEVGRWLQNAQDQVAREAALSALGNLGPKDLTLLDPYLAGGDTNLRARAYFAMRFSPANDAAQRLADGVKTQTSPSVRRDALEALTLRPKDDRWLAAISSVPFAQLDAAEQMALARSISGARDLEAKARVDLLKRLQSGTTDAQVMQTVQEYLGQF
jgi:hypothetical protein